LKKGFGKERGIVDRILHELQNPDNHEPTTNGSTSFVSLGSIS
jgi:hypothetical protein